MEVQRIETHQAERLVTELDGIPEELQSMMALGKAHLEANRLEEAATAYEEVVRRFGGVEEDGAWLLVNLALSLQATAFNFLRDRERSLECQQQILRRAAARPTSLDRILVPAALELSARIHFIAGRHAEADACLVELTDLLRDDPKPEALPKLLETLQLHADVLSGMGRWSDGLEAVRLGIARVPHDADPETLRLVAHLRLEEVRFLVRLERRHEALRTCEAVLQRYLQTRPVWDVVWELLEKRVVLLRELGRPKDAHTAIQAAFQWDLAVGRFYMEASDEDLRAAVIKPESMAPRVMRLQSELALTHTARGDHAGALEVYETMLKDSRRDAGVEIRRLCATAMMKRGETLLALKRRGEALDAFAMAGRRFESDRDSGCFSTGLMARVHQAELLRTMRRLEECIEVCTRIDASLHDLPADAQVVQWAAARMVLARALLESGRAGEALERLEEGLVRYRPMDTKIPRAMLRDMLLVKVAICVHAGRLDGQLEAWRELGRLLTGSTAPDDLRLCTQAHAEQKKLVRKLGWDN